MVVMAVVDRVLSRRGQACIVQKLCTEELAASVEWGDPVLVLVLVHQEGKEEVEVCQEIRCMEFVAQFPMDIRMESAVKTGGMGRIPLM